MCASTSWLAQWMPREKEGTKVISTNVNVAHKRHVDVAFDRSESGCDRTLRHCQ